MSYSLYLLIFILLPSVFMVLLMLIRRNKTEIYNFYASSLTAIILLSIIALIYTTPWDNYLVANSIWYYDPSKVIGIVLGYVPIEEYSFFILETLFVCLFLMARFQHSSFKFSQKAIFSMTKNRLLSVFLLASIWILSLVSFLSNDESMMYLNLLLLWAIPPLALQIFIGWNFIVKNKNIITSTIFLLGTYLSVTDAFAIYNGIWTINPSFTTGVILLIPLEEILFFFLTTTLISIGYVLILGISYWQSQYQVPYKTSKVFSTHGQ